MKAATAIAFAIFLVFVSAQWVCAAHPAEGKSLPQTAERTLSPQHGYLPGWDINELTFPLVGETPTFDELSFLEVYMVCGVVCEEDGKTCGLLPWATLIFNAVVRFHTEFGYVPSELAEETIKSIPGLEELSAEKLAEYRNPLTGEWPRLDAQEFSPGDCYVRPLTEDEKQHFAALRETYHDHWYEGQAYSMIAGRDVSVEMLTEPFYLKVYGLNETLLTQIQYSWREN